MPDNLPFPYRPGLYVSQGFVESAQTQGITEMHTHSRDIHYLTAIALRTDIQVESVALKHPNENGKQAATQARYAFVPSSGDISTVTSYDMPIQEVRAESGPFFLAATSEANEPDIAMAVVKAAQKLRGHYTDTNVYQGFGYAGGGAIGLATNIIEWGIRGVENYAFPMDAYFLRIVGGMAAGRAILTPILRAGVRKFNEDTIRSHRPVQLLSTGAFA